MSGLPGIVQNCHSTRHKYQILHITTTAVHLSYRLLYFKPPNNVAGKLISEAPYFRRFFFVNRRKAIFDVVTGSPIFFFIRRMSPKKFFLHKTSSPFFCESPKNLEISRLRRQSLQKEQKYLYFEMFYGGQKLHKYFRSLLIKDTSLLIC